ncbi:hypothetical protein IEQ34_017237 [Dendrobium chrysotoxum]|uniref:EF-hand domain-containing protein n=1 Tax=Dendrobium chrysotoxum TaxID=161865 RepID=A0AAV7GC09_DENCH|nr:hypothetical protein IEQ34_017237 [Dendrobium chrysotoxum]
MEEVEAIVESFDSDGDGVLRYDDIVKLLDMEEEEERDATIREAFSAYNGLHHGEKPPVGTAAVGRGEEHG